MKQINNGFADYYYLTKDGRIYNAATNTYKEPDNAHKFKLKRVENGYKTIALKSLYKIVYNQNYCEDKIENLNDEEWKVIDNTDSIYYISSLGRIKSYHGYKALLLNPYSNQNGYLRVDIVEEGQRQTKLVHRLVAAAFLPNPPKIDFQLHHIDGKKDSNAANNLVWLSPVEHRKKHKELEEKRRNTTNVCTESEENNH